MSFSLVNIGIFFKDKFIYILILFFIISCSPKNKLKEGKIIYQIEYPNNKDNFFLYHVLPKEMTTSFKKNKMEVKILKAGMENTVIIDNIAKNMFAFYSYDERFVCNLSQKEIKRLINSRPKYAYKFLKETDTLFGLTVKKAIATDPNRPYDPIEIWYTQDLSLKNSNWFNGFDKIPGVLIKYHIVQNNIKMVFTAIKIEKTSLNDSIFEFNRKGKKVSYSKFSKLIDDLFDTFNE